jgi:hypothetical protein
MYLALKSPLKIAAKFTAIDTNHKERWSLFRVGLFSCFFGETQYIVWIYVVCLFALE